MANSYLDSIQQARQFVQEHLKDWDAIDKKVLEVVGNAQKITSVPADSGSIKELNNRIQENVELRKQLNVVINEQGAKIKALQAQLSKLSTTQKSHTKDLSDEERQLRTLAKSEQRLLDVKSEHWKTIEANRQAANQEARAIRNRLTDYGQYSQQLSQMSEEYKNLAIQKLRLNNLTTEEIKRMDALEKQITQLRSQLVQVDHSVGQFGRSVGSYGKQFDSLGFSIAQITREMPAFAYGAQIGFAALSNNIPMLFDEITKVRGEVTRLRKEGKATASVMSRLASSIFGLQTLLSIGVTLLTLYGADLIEAAGGMFDFRDEAEKAKDAIKDLDENLEKHIEGLRELAKVQLKGQKNAQEELLTLKLLNRQLQDTTLSEDDRRAAIDKLRKQYPEHLKNMSDEELLANGLKGAYDSLAQSILEAAKARAAFDKIVENSGKQIEVASLLATKRLELADAQKAANAAEQTAIDLVASNSRGQEKALAIAEKRKKAVADLEAEIHSLEGTQQSLEMANVNLEETITDLTDVTGANTKANSGNTKAKREQIKALEEMNMVRRYSVAYYEQLISALQEEQKKVSRSSKEWKIFQENIDKARESIAMIVDIQKWARDELAMSPDELGAFTIEVTTKLSTVGIERGMKELSKITGESLEDLYAEMHNWYGKDFEAFMKFWEAKMAKEEEAAEKAKELRKQIAEAAIDFGNALFKAEIDRIEQRIEANKDYYAQILAGEELTEERRAALEAERDLRERQLMKEKRKRENQQFLFEQGVALARVAMHTATAITEALPNLGLATLMGILGGIQAATIVALSIPKFAMGTENAPEGLAIVDEVRPEVHTDRYGNVKSYGSDKGPNLRFLEQGDKIYRSREEYLKKVGPKGLENTIFDLNMKHQGKPVPPQEVNDALLREIAALRGENSKMWREVRKLASRPIFNNVKVEMPDTRPY